MFLFGFAVLVTLKKMGAVLRVGWGGGGTAGGGVGWVNLRMRLDSHEGGIQ